MTMQTKIELYKYAKHFILKHNNQIAKTFLNQIKNNSKDEIENDLLNELIELIDNNNYKNYVINKIDIIIKNKKNYPKLTAWIIP